ncbi:MAG: glutaredoxin family protein [Candidatus Hydrothermarchaeota archaeon]
MIKTGPLKIIMFTSPTCIICDYVYEALKKMTKGYGNRVKIELIDVTMYPEVVEKYNLTVLPTVIIGDTRIVGDYILSELDEVQMIIMDEVKKKKVKENE